MVHQDVFTNWNFSPRIQVIRSRDSGNFPPRDNELAMLEACSGRTSLRAREVQYRAKMCAIRLWGFGSASMLIIESSRPILDGSSQTPWGSMQFTIKIWKQTWYYNAIEDKMTISPLGDSELAMVRVRFGLNAHPFNSLLHMCTTNTKARAEMKRVNVAGMTVSATLPRWGTSVRERTATANLLVSGVTLVVFENIAENDVISSYGCMFWWLTNFCSCSARRLLNVLEWDVHSVNFQEAVRRIELVGTESNGKLLQIRARAWRGMSASPRRYNPGVVLHPRSESKWMWDVSRPNIFKSTSNERETR